MSPKTRAQLEQHVARVVADWKPLTDEQLDRIGALLRGGSRAGNTDAA